MAETGNNARVGIIVSRHVNSLEGGNGTAFCRGDAFLQFTHFRSQRRLVTDGGRHTSQQRGDFHTGQRVAINIIDEQEHVLPFFVAEKFGHRQTGQSDAETHGRGLVHLPEDHYGFVDDAGGFHFIPEVVAFTGTFPDTGKNRETAVFGGDITDKFLDDHGLANTRAAVRTDLTALGKRRYQVDNFQTGLQQLRSGFLFDK